MTDQVKVEISTDNAVLLLAAAHELGLDPSVVQVRSGKFIVPSEVNAKAFDVRDDDEPKKTAKKTTTKKAQE